MNSRFKLVVVSSSTFLVVLLLLGAVMGKARPPKTRTVISPFIPKSFRASRASTSKSPD